MIIRGAPAIGQAAAIGMALTASASPATKPVRPPGDAAGRAPTCLRNARPDGGQPALGGRPGDGRATSAIGDLSEDGDAIADAMRAEADAIVFEATEDHGRLAAFGLERARLPEPTGRSRILTHCNTGPLACGQFGTALGVVQAAHHAGRDVHVWVDETRPYLQGARLTAWELAQAGVPHTLIPDVAAGHLMARGEVDVVIVGADRIAANGDTANKVGTYPLAVLAARHGIPFYVAAPISTVDLATPDGAAIPIEERPATRSLASAACASRRPSTEVRNPAFDVTPAELITGDRHRGGRAPAAVRRGRPGGSAVAASRERTPVPRRARSRRRLAGRRPPDGHASRSAARSAAVARQTTDRAAAARRSSSSDRLYAAYAICDLEEREFGRTRWGAAYDGDELVAVGSRVHRPDAAAAVRDGHHGRHRGGPARRHPAARRVHRGAPATMLPAVEAHYRVDPGPQMVRMWVDRAHFRPYPATVQRLLPVEIGELNRLYQLGFASWLPVERDRRRRLLRDARQRPARRRGRHPRRSARRRAWRSSATC